MTDQPARQKGVSSAHARFQPAGGDHAIMQCAFNMKLSREPKEAELAGLFALYPRYAEQGFEQKKLETFQVQIVQNSVDRSSSIRHRPMTMAGYLFARLGERSHCVREMKLEGDTLGGVIDIYTRWNPVLDAVCQLLKPLLTELETLRLTAESVSLEYVDQFHLRCETPTADAVSQVIRASGLFAANILSIDGAWHSTHGYFEPLNAAPFKKSLVNVNISLAPQTPADRWTLTLVTQHRAMEPTADTASRSLLEVFRNTVEHAHQRNKDMLAEILTPEAQQLISLNAAEKP